MESNTHEYVDTTQILGDVTKLTSFLIVIVSLLKQKSCQGWSGRTQILRALVYFTRYWCLISSTNYTIYHIIANICWIALSFFILYLMYIRFRKTIDKKCDTFWIESVLIACLFTAFLSCRDVWSPEEILWLFSHYAEALAILPQYYFIFHKGKKELIVTYYIVILIYTKLLDMGHWTDMYARFGYVNPYTVYPGIVQLAIYAAYFIIPNGKSQEPEAPPQRILPKYLTQESLLETPLLKRSATASSSIYVIGCESNYSTLTRSVNSFGSGSSSDEGRY